MLKAEPSLDPRVPFVCSSACECGEVPGQVIADKTSLVKEEVSGKFLMVTGVRMPLISDFASCSFLTLCHL